MVMPSANTRLSVYGFCHTWRTSSSFAPSFFSTKCVHRFAFICLILRVPALSLIIYIHPFSSLCLSNDLNPPAHTPFNNFDTRHLQFRIISSSSWPSPAASPSGNSLQLHLSQLVDPSRTAFELVDLHPAPKIYFARFRSSPHQLLLSQGLEWFNHLRP